jgi:phospholipase/carboxylesterase
MNPFDIPHSVWQPSFDGTKKTLMIILHGRGDSPAGWLTWQSELGIPSLNVLLLQAPDDYYGGYSWYGMSPNQLPGIVRSRELLKNIFSEIENKGFKPAQCILFGFSQGCLMTLEFGARYPQLLKGYIGVSGYCYNPEALLIEAVPQIIHQGKWLITHGTEDDVLPIETTRAQVKLLQERGFKIDYREYKKTHTIAEDETNDIRNWLQNLLE